MLTYLFYLVGIWLAISLVLVLMWGTHVHHSDFFTSLLYLGLIVGLGDALAIAFGVPINAIYFASIAAIAVGIPFIITFRDWNAMGQAFFLFSLAASLTYLAYAFLVT